MISKNLEKWNEMNGCTRVSRVLCVTHWLVLKFEMCVLPSHELRQWCLIKMMVETCTRSITLLLVCTHRHTKIELHQRNHNERKRVGKQWHCNGNWLSHSFIYFWSTFDVLHLVFLFTCYMHSMRTHMFTSSDGNVGFQKFTYTGYGKCV